MLQGFGWRVSTSPNSSGIRIYVSIVLLNNIPRSVTRVLKNLVFFSYHASFTKLDIIFCAVTDINLIRFTPRWIEAQRENMGRRCKKNFASWPMFQWSLFRVSKSFDKSCFPPVSFYSASKVRQRENYLSNLLHYYRWPLSSSGSLSPWRNQAASEILASDWSNKFTSTCCLRCRGHFRFVTAEWQR